MFSSKLLNILKTLNQLPSIAWGQYKSKLHHMCAERNGCSSLHRSPQEIWGTDSRSAPKTAYVKAHPITNGHGHQVSFPCESPEVLYEVLYSSGSIPAV
ncbi:hypothetical protein Y032_0102g3436 [Ancylostoma ceylanicum]|uniref:Uncharacterized protein n=1 Tax=Ancylostoma ceylanicum TaxID=53326 RepID=A0A016THE6_9BILA|nr:hypothetical protein Y032_0102g3436 [Ancylostoma ceylanicum]